MGTASEPPRQRALGLFRGIGVFGECGAQGKNRGALWAGIVTGKKFFDFPRRFRIVGMKARCFRLFVGTPKQIQ
jgi:hypothetical protein